MRRSQHHARRRERLRRRAPPSRPTRNAGGRTRRWSSAREHPQRRRQAFPLRRTAMASSVSLRSLFDGGGLKAAPSFLAGLLENTAREGPENQFASWLPYVAYAPDDKIFVNRDTLGFMVELMPQSGADERMVEILLSLYATCPKGTGIQFSLFASPHVIDSLRRYGNLRVEDADHAEKA